MLVTTLLLYDMKRIRRHTGLCLVFLAVPLVTALARIALPGSRITLAFAWSCPVACAALVIGAMYARSMIDRLSGFEAALLVSPLTRGTLIASRVATGATILLAQMLVLLTILAIRF